MADRDLITAERIMADDDPFTNIVAFHCQQAIEKYLKGYLIEHDVPLEKIHDLVKLYGTILKIKDLGLDKDKLFLISEVYTETRYPGGIGPLPDGLPSDEEAQEFVEYAKEIQTIILTELKK
ncbi:MAG: hypothetical protein Pg6C_05570 [Treponemataceae bacterium]|nr:MAG: hypothetical protein Pg6C_05570 [Treponemataceae bacterium]